MPLIHRSRHAAPFHTTRADGQANLAIMIILREPDGSRPTSLSPSTRLCQVKTCPTWELLLVLILSGLYFRSGEKELREAPIQETQDCRIPQHTWKEFPAHSTCRHLPSTGMKRASARTSHHQKHVTQTVLLLPTVETQGHGRNFTSKSSFSNQNQCPMK